MAMNGAQHKIVNLLKTFFFFFFFAHQFLLVFVYLMCGLRQLFFQCGPEMPKVWTPLDALPGRPPDIPVSFCLQLTPLCCFPWQNHEDREHGYLVLRAPIIPSSHGSAVYPNSNSPSYVGLISQALAFRPP